MKIWEPVNTNNPHFINSLYTYPLIAMTDRKQYYYSNKTSMANQWFKFFAQDYISDIKMSSLSACARHCWVILLCRACEGNGTVKFLTEKKLMLDAGVDPLKSEWQETEGVLNKFVELGMIRINDPAIRIVNWSKRQESYLTGAERASRHRNKSALRSSLGQRDGEVTKVTLEENRIRIEKNKNRKEERGSANTPAKDAISFFKGGEKYEELLREFSKNGNPEQITVEFNKFILYWTESNKSGTKQKWQQQDTFEVKRRLFTWLSRVETDKPYPQKSKVFI